MNLIVQRFENIKSLTGNSNTKIVAVSKTFPLTEVLPLINHGHEHFGENKVQEAIEKWNIVKKNNPNINLHMIGKLQSNKVKFALRIFDYIHSLDSEKLANKIAKHEKVANKKLKYFIQVNIGNEEQKSIIAKKVLMIFIIILKKN